MTRRQIDVDGIRLSALDEGQGDPVLVLHGFSGDVESMESVSHALREDHRVITLELVGHGESDAPSELTAYTMAACARQIGAAVDVLDLGRPALLGYSMGGRAALAAAVASPRRFVSLILIGATAGIVDPALRAERILADEALADRIEAEGVERFVEEWMSLPIFASQSRLGPEVLARAKAQRLRNSARGLANSLRGMGAGAQAPLFDALAAVDLPTLLVVGEEDEKFKAIAVDLESRLPDAQVAILSAAGHAAHLEAPREFAEVVSRFLGSRSAYSASTNEQGVRAQGDPA
jgi:2-succinyl-6-hydroxy-2,4-cyclohexadiene-1-carboxylate synthase